MSYQIIAFVILITWAVLLAVYFPGRACVRNRYLKDAPIIHIADAAMQTNKPGSPSSRIGSLFVFGTNIATFTLVFIAAFSPASSQRLAWASVGLPLWVNVLGSILSVLNAIWGLLALFFNPNYTPLFQPTKDQFLLATRGPYALVRHPRYAAEIWLNVILFMFTGIWIPLLGALGWVAMYYQARDEENHVMALAGEVYGKYHQRTGMLFPRFSGGC
jgi:protein-S-isoprenylcysteine O-methyltransferase Ste14